MDTLITEPIKDVPSDIINVPILGPNHAEREVRKMVLMAQELRSVIQDAKMDLAAIERALLARVTVAGRRRWTPFEGCTLIAKATPKYDVSEQTAKAFTREAKRLGVPDKDIEKACSVSKPVTITSNFASMNKIAKDYGGKLGMIMAKVETSYGDPKLSIEQEKKHA